ncbi:GW dipeptide domain-containing protein [Jeotgalibaca sp. A122]|uniref:GW dipeptide domain-containing protein n=1 Tax=Jeotgalibaca sp. A122 TaxID=3457322 RepID=UPI003FD12591
MKQKALGLFVALSLFTFQMPTANATDVNTNTNSYYTVHSTTAINYEAMIVKPWSINTAPWGTSGAFPIPNYSQYVGKHVSVVQEKVTSKATYALIYLNGVELGWIDSTGLAPLTVNSTTDVYYTAQINLPWSINTQPWGTKGYQPIADYRSYVNAYVEVIQEKQTDKATYALLVHNGIELGWIDKGALKETLFVMEETPINYEAKVLYGWSINSQPWGTPNAQFVQNATKLIGKNVTVLKEAKTAKAKYALIANNGTELGWIDTGALSPLVVESYNEVLYDAKITRTWSINTQPWGTAGYELISDYQSYLGKSVRVIQEAKTGKSNYALITYNGTQLGWIDTGALETFIPVLSEEAINYEATIVNPWSINTQPWGTIGSYPSAKGVEYLGKNVSIIAEKVTPKATYALISYKGNELGWIDTTGLKPLEVLSAETINYSAQIVHPWSITNVPWGTRGYYHTANANDYKGLELKVTEEKITEKATYAYLSHNGNGLGWIDKGALKIVLTVLETRDTAYEAIVVKPWAIHSKPWGTAGSYSVADSSKFVGKHVSILQEKVTPKGTYGLLTQNGVEIGWMDVTGLNPLSVQSTHVVQYASKLVKPWALTNVPWGTYGYKTSASSSEYIGSEVVVTEEKTTQKATYAYLTHNGRDLGWIDKSALDAYKITSRKPTYYKVKITKPWSINTQPWGIEGYKAIPNYSSYVGQEVRVIEEVTTTRGVTYGLLTLNGAALGWIDLGGVSSPITGNYTVFLDIGHGGFDPGASYYGVQEKRINLEVSLKMQKLLEEKGYNVIVSRTSDVFIDHKTERSRLANETNADVFVSVHHNAMPGNTFVNGIETFYYEYDSNYQPKINALMHNNLFRIQESAELAYSIHESLIESSGAYDRGVRRDTFAVLRETAIPAVLLELGFMSNQAELNRLTSQNYQNTLAQAVVNGIDNYFK